MKGTKYIPSRNIETIKNHFLPKSYLQLFESKNGTILFYDKKTNETSYLYGSRVCNITDCRDNLLFII